MQINCIWKGREYHSLENCLVNIYDRGAEICSTIVGYYEGIIYKVDYTIRTNQRWETIYLSMCSRHSNETRSIMLEGDGKGNWLLDGMRADQFSGCIDIDISLTPFTNTLPVNRLQMAPHQKEEIQVIYLDVLQQQMRPVRQQYTCLSGTLYRYQNIPNDFQADITIDENGLVVDYPLLFERTATLQTAYTGERN